MREKMTEKEREKACTVDRERKREKIANMNEEEKQIKKKMKGKA